jgi:thiol-disulfide isomerase/thioredoxin
MASKVLSTNMNNILRYLVALTIFTIYHNTSMAQHEGTPTFITTTDPKHPKEKMLVGQVNTNDLMQYSWYSKDVAEYMPDSASIEALKPLIASLNIIIAIGTWCGDTQDLLPPTLKVLQAAGVPSNKVSLFAMDRSKKALNAEHQIYNIEKLPTIIIYDQNLEVGRIIESINTPTIEQALINLLSKYKQQH